MVLFNFTLNKNTIEYVTSFTNQGVIFDSKLSFNNHINMITNKSTF